jgi:hypothetical protein
MEWDIRGGMIFSMLLGLIDGIDFPTFVMLIL